jgi:Flp pilus assembly protein TadG
MAIIDSAEGQDAAQMMRGGLRASPRRGAAVLEAIIALPILLIALFGTFLFTTLLMVRSGVKQAAIEGAREASKVRAAAYDAVDAGTCPPANPPAADDVVDAAVAAVDEVLGTYGLQTGDSVQVIVNDNAAVTYRGEQIVNPCAIARTGCDGKVEVRVIVRYSAIPIPDLLDVFGFSVSGENFDFAAMGRRYGIACP